jgi:hypothetical protein
MHLSNKFMIFFLGLSIGLLIGAGFFIFKIDDYISKMSFFKSAPDTVVKVEHDKEGQKQSANQNKTWAQNKRNSVAKDSAGNKNDSLKVLTQNLRSDSLQPDSSVIHSTTTTDDIVVKKDELVAATTIDVTNVGGAESKNPKDSLLQKESGIRDDKNPVTAYQVEFWRSPINYKGYKMLKNKIVLFGIAQGENLKLYKIEDALYMKQQQNVYRLSFTDDFRQFESVKDQSVLARIK